MKHIGRFFMLFLAFFSGILGILLFKSISRDFSLMDSSLLILTRPLASTLFMTLGAYLGFHAFKKMGSS